MHEFTRKLLTEWRNLDLPFSNKNILIAVSGGADSCSLAYAISNLAERKKLNNQFIIAHFNHNLRGLESEKDVEFVKEVAKELGFAFETSIAKSNEIDPNSNTEQTARIARYKFLERIAEKTNSYAVLTGHTQNDQAETLLLNLIRGSGTQGLAAMKSIRKLSKQSHVLLIRPMLNWAKREDIKIFASQNKISYRQDSMNLESSYKRVQIRKELLPYLKKYNPNIIETLCNSSNILRKENDLLNELLFSDKEFQTLINSDVLKISKVKVLSISMLYKVLQAWLLNHRGDLRGLEFTHFEAIKDIIHSRKSGKIVELPQFERIVKEKGLLTFQKLQVEK